MGFNMLMGSSMTKTVGALFIAFFSIGAAKLDGVQSLPPNWVEYDFFYFILQWPGSYCNTKAGCCYPTTGKPPSDFSIQGLWPNSDGLTYAISCDDSNPLTTEQISDMTWKLNHYWVSLDCPSSDSFQFWEQEWLEHGTCSENVLNQTDYFAAAVRLKEEVDVLGSLEKGGVRPDGEGYFLNTILNAVPGGGIMCNKNESGDVQLYQIYLCADHSASKIIPCPVLPDSQCASPIVFPSF
eukprot:PITA_04204